MERTSPAGARQPGETPDAAARRELCEVTALVLPLHEPVDHVTEDVALCVASDAEVEVDAEHEAEPAGDG